MKVLVTGASGFLGASLSNALLEQGDSVVSIRHDKTPIDPAKALGIDKEITWCDGDIAKDGNLVKRIIADYDVQLVFHLAALPLVQVGLRTTIPMFETNLMGTVQVLEALKEEYLMGYDIPLVHMSTDKVYGTTDWGRKYLETDPLNAEIPYEASKAMADIAVRTYKASSFIKRASVVRPSNIYGPGDMNSRIIPNTIRNFLAGKPGQLWRNYTYVREYTFVQDWIDAMLKVAKFTFDTGGEVFNIGSGFNAYQADVINEIGKHFPKVGVIEVDPPDYSKKEIPYQALDHSKIQKMLNWEARTPFKVGISETVDWWKGREPFDF